MHLKFCAALVLLTPVVSASTLELKTHLQSCKQISDEEQRLSCFDAIVSQLDSKELQMPENTEKVSSLIISEASEANNTPLAKTPPQHTIQDFGFKTPKSYAETLEIISTVKSTQTDLRNKLLITLENGQKWQQVEQSYFKVKIGDNCTVKRGSFGSFFLSIEGLDKKIRVRRVE